MSTTRILHKCTLLEYTGHTMDPVKFGHWLQKTRQDKGLSQDGLAAKLRVSKSHLSNLENASINPVNGKPRLPSFDLIDQLCDVFNVSVFEVLEGAGYTPARKDFSADELRILSLYGKLSPNLKKAVLAHLQALWQEFPGSDIQQDEVLSGFTTFEPMAVPIISDSVVAKEKPDEEGKSDGRTDDRDSHNRNSKRRKTG